MLREPEKELEPPPVREIRPPLKVVAEAILVNSNLVDTEPVPLSHMVNTLVPKSWITKSPVPLRLRVKLLLSIEMEAKPSLSSKPVNWVEAAEKFQFPVTVSLAALEAGPLVQSSLTDDWEAVLTTVNILASKEIEVTWEKVPASLGTSMPVKEEPAPWSSSVQENLPFSELQFNALLPAPASQSDNPPPK